MRRKLTVLTCGPKPWPFFFKIVKGVGVRDVRVEGLSVKIAEADISADLGGSRYYSSCKLEVWVDHGFIGRSYRYEWVGPKVLTNVLLNFCFIYIPENQPKGKLVNIQALSWMLMR